MNILISNDDGVFAPGILAAKQAVEDLANVCVVAPDKNNSSVGRRLTLFKHLEINQCELEDGSPAYSVSGSPADCVVVGADYVMDAKPDLVISGINQGVNINWYMEYDFTLAKKVLHDIVSKIIDDGFPEGVDLFNLNVPSNYDSEEVKITHLSHKMLDKQVIDNTDEEKREIFNYPLEDNQESDGLIMITPDLVKDYEEGSDGYALMVDRCPSLTPLKVNMTYDDLKNW